MPNYKESPVTGTQWIRSHSVQLNNPYQGIPTITFLEEKIIQAGTAVVKAAANVELGSDLTLRLLDPANTFPLLDPATDLPIGAATHGQVYALLYSLYRAAAATRDAKP